MAKRAPLREVLDEAEIAGLIAHIERDGAASNKELTKLRASPKALAMLHERLAKKGFERTGKGFRVPIAVQITKLLDKEALFPAAQLAKRVAGGSAAEIKRAIVALAREDVIAIVTREKKDHLTKQRASVLTSDEVEALENLKKSLEMLLKSARAKKGAPRKTLWRADVDKLFGRDRSGERLLRELDALAAKNRGLAFVPELAKKLAAEVDAKQVRDLLVAASREGKVELRPESGVGLLSAEDAALCPKGPGGAPLSWARLIRPELS